MLTIDVPGLMMIFAVAIIAYLIICFFIGAVSSIYIYFRFYFFQIQSNHICELLHYMSQISINLISNTLV